MDTNLLDFCCSAYAVVLIIRDKEESKNFSLPVSLYKVGKMTKKYMFQEKWERQYILIKFEIFSYLNYAYAFCAKTVSPFCFVTCLFQHLCWHAL